MRRYKHALTLRLEDEVYEVIKAKAEAEQKKPGQIARQLLEIALKREIEEWFRGS